MQGWELGAPSHCIPQQTTPQTSPVLTPLLLQLLATGPPSIPASPLQAQTPWGDLWGNPGGHPPSCSPPPGMWPGSTDPIPWAHLVLSPGLAPPALQMGSSPTLLQLHTSPGHLQGILPPRGTRGWAVPGDMRMDEAQGPGVDGATAAPASASHSKPAPRESPQQGGFT